MKATLNTADQTSRFSFNVVHDNLNYVVVIHLNAKGKFIDDSITLNDQELELEGTDGQIREDIINYLDKNWKKLTANAWQFPAESVE